MGGSRGESGAGGKQGNAGCPPGQPASQALTCDIADDAHCQAGAGEGVARDELLGHTQQPPQGPHLVLQGAGWAGLCVLVAVVQRGGG